MVKFRYPHLKAIHEVLSTYGVIPFDKVQEKIDYRITPRHYYHVIARTVGSIKGTKRQTVLQLALRVAANVFGKDDFTIMELAEECWKHHPNKFGFQGEYGHYPDTRQIGFLVFPSRKQFKMFEATKYGRYRINEQGWELIQKDLTIPEGDLDPAEVLRSTDAYRIYCEKGTKGLGLDEVTIFRHIVSNLEKDESLEPKLRQDESTPGKLLLQLYLYLKKA